jgi:Cu/Ag efflux protein CusF
MDIMVLLLVAFSQGPKRQKHAVVYLGDDVDMDVAECSPSHEIVGDEVPLPTNIDAMDPETVSIVVTHGMVKVGIPIMTMNYLHYCRTIMILIKNGMTLLAC